MANEVLVKEKTQILFNNSATYAPATALNDIEVGTPTDVQIDLTAILDTEARASTKADLGALRAAAYSVIAAIEMQATPVTGEVIEFYWAPSAVSVAGTGNPGGVTGTDADYTGSPATLAEGVAKLIFIGVMVMSADANIQVDFIGILVPPTRFGMLVVKNEAGATTGADVVETAIAFDPIVDEVQ